MPKFKNKKRLKIIIYNGRTDFLVTILELLRSIKGT